MKTILISFICIAVGATLSYALFARVGPQVKPISDPKKIISMINNGQLNPGTENTFYIGTTFPYIDYSLETDHGTYDFVMFFEPGLFVSVYSYQGKVYAARRSTGATGLSTDKWFFADTDLLTDYINELLNK